jgi:RND family efflux transporter MFP subunit
LLAAEARVVSTDAALAKTKLSLERTQITAPFAGRVLHKMVDLGQVTGNNTQVAEVYATDFIEVRLPLRDSDLQFIDLPESYRWVNTEINNSLPVTLYSSITGDRRGWQVVRTESAIDENSRQLHVVAQIDDPFGEAAVGRSPLKIGEYVTAELQGKLIADAIIIPADAIYQSSYAYVVENNVLIRREIEIAWQNTTEALIESGLKAGDHLVTTTLGQVTSGLRVAIEGEARERPAQGQPGQRPEGRFSEGSAVPSSSNNPSSNTAESSNISKPSSASELSNTSERGDRS